jgi:hypothetical protein
MTIDVAHCKPLFQVSVLFMQLEELTLIGLALGSARKDGIFYLTFAALFDLHLVGSLLPQML